MPVMLGVLAILAIAYRYYSAFLAAKVAVLDDSRITPAHRHNDGQNFDPTNRWVLFGHHFAAISGAGPLIGPVLAIQFGYLPGLVWLVVGVCLAGAVQDMMVLAASTRRDGLSLAGLARSEIGRPAGLAAAIAILYIVIIALAGLGIVVVKALGRRGSADEGRDRAGLSRRMQASSDVMLRDRPADLTMSRRLRPIDSARRPNRAWSSTRRFDLAVPRQVAAQVGSCRARAGPAAGATRGGWCRAARGARSRSPARSRSRFSSAGTCTASARARSSRRRSSARPPCWAATVGGAWIPGSQLEPYFSLSRNATIFALAAYGFIAAVLPVWLLLCPRDYLSTFLKIGTILLLVAGVIDRQPQARMPRRSALISRPAAAPTSTGQSFPYVFICIMCGAISGFHALVSSGTTPKMVDRESDVRMIGYGAMLMEGLVGVVALIAAAALPNSMYYDINIDLGKRPEFLAKHHDFAQFLQAERSDRPGGRARPSPRGRKRAGRDGEGRARIAARPDRRGRHAGRRHGADLLRAPCRA